VLSNRRATLAGLREGGRHPHTIPSRKCKKMQQYSLGFKQGLKRSPDSAEAH